MNNLPHIIERDRRFGVALEKQSDLLLFFQNYKRTQQPGCNLWIVKISVDHQVRC